MSRRPVDLSIGNSIIAAFAQGRQEALERLKNKQAQEQQAIANQRDIEEAERRKQQDVEQKRQFEERLKQEKNFFDAQQLLSKAGFDVNKELAGITASKELTQQAQEGATPAGYKDITPGLDQEVADLMKVFGEPSLVTQGKLYQREGESQIKPEKIQITNPAFIAREKEIAELRKAEATQKRTQENELFKSSIISAEKQAELNQSLLIHRENNAKDLEIARMNAAAKQSAGEGVPSLVPALLENPDLAYDVNFGTPKMRGEAAGWLAENGYNLKSNQQKVVNDLAPRTLDIINDVLTDKDFVSGFWSVLKNIPGSHALASDKKLEALKSALTVPEIKFIKGLGQMSNADRDFITRLASSIDIGSPTLIDDIKKLKKIYEKVVSDITPNLTPVGTKAPVKTSKPNPADFDKTKR